MRWWDRWQQKRWLNAPPKRPGRGNIGGDPIPTKLAVDPIIGRRLWRVANDGGQLGLQSIHIGVIWDSHMTAECRNGGYGFNKSGHEDFPPSLSCACGIYAQLPDKRIKEWWFAVGGRVHATGDVALSGRVIKCEKGYKAQYAEIVPPVFLDVSCCFHNSECTNDVSRIALPENYVAHYFGYCSEHADNEAPLVDADVWMTEAARELSDRYGFEVLHWR